MDQRNTAASSTLDTTGTKTALLVEDDDTSRFLGKLLLEKKGLIVNTAVNGSEAVEMATKAEYDIIFMDVSMPLMNGYEATRLIRLKEKTRHPIIAMTAHAMNDDRLRCLEAGMDDYLSKPIMVSELYRVLEQWLGNR